MTRRQALILSVCAWPLPGQTKMTVRQLLQFLRSSLQLRHDDKHIAAYLRRVVLTERLDGATIETLQGEGIGPRTAQALEVLRESSRGLGASVPEAPKAPPPQIPPPSYEEQMKVIETARQWALNYTDNLPNFICTQVTRRFADPSGLEFWHQLDTVVTKLSFFERKEDYQVVLINNTPTQIKLEELGGTISRGEFGTMMKELFEPATNASFHWQRWATLRGRRMHVYGYEVEQSRSKFSISVNNRDHIVAAYKGEVFIDRDTGTISRIRQEAINIPPAFPVQQAYSVLDYDMVEIGTSSFLLPLKNAVRMRQGKFLSRNDIEFRMYRKFGTESTITFAPDPLPEDQTREQTTPQR